MQTAQMTRKRYPTTQKSQFTKRDFRMTEEWCVNVSTQRINDQLGRLLVFSAHWHSVLQEGNSCGTQRNHSPRPHPVFSFSPRCSLSLFTPWSSLTLPSGWTKALERDTRWLHLTCLDWPYISLNLSEFPHWVKDDRQLLWTTTLITGRNQGFPEVQTETKLTELKKIF